MEEYYVLSDNPKIREGTYVKYRSGSLGFVVLESGRYKNGFKDGLWETFYNAHNAFNKNGIKEKGHYVNGKKNGTWLYYYVDTLNNVTKAKAFGTKKNKPDSISIYIEQDAAKLRQAGMFLNDKRVGPWSSFDDEGNLIQRVNYSTGRIYDKLLGDSIDYNLNHDPVFLGGTLQLNFVLAFEMKRHEIFGEARLEKICKETTARAFFTVDQQGKIKNPHISESSGFKKFDAELLRLISTTENLWLPAIKEGQKVESNTNIRMIVRCSQEEQIYYFTYSFEFNMP